MKTFFLFLLASSISTMALADTNVSTQPTHNASANSVLTSSVPTSNNPINNAPTNTPAELISACKGLAERDACQFHNHAHELTTGTCKMKALTQDNFDLVCVPDPVSSLANSSSDSAGEPAPHKHSHKRH